ncbi:hypothetical protein D3C77_538570 [compost metagenome]
MASPARYAVAPSTRSINPKPCCKAWVAMTRPKKTLRRSRSKPSTASWWNCAPSWAWSTPSSRTTNSNSSNWANSCNRWWPRCRHTACGRPSPRKTTRPAAPGSTASCGAWTKKSARTRNARAPCSPCKRTPPASTSSCRPPTRPSSKPSATWSNSTRPWPTTSSSCSKA